MITNYTFDHAGGFGCTFYENVLITSEFILASLYVVVLAIERQGLRYQRGFLYT